MPLWLYWILLGLVAGTLAKYLVPGRDPSGCIVTVVLGIVGAFIGGLIGTRLGWGRVAAGSFDLRSIGIATLGAIVLLLMGRLVRRI
ncbi:MAG: GlsB/YeaQ/YmgE family stress response membrane protein [Gemmatimonadaceae bacterium]|nr:GlsB/YeaQ/YmgE family stress response membrane protein [Gemmatimonadaceae bacterium]